LFFLPPFPASVASVRLGDIFQYKPVSSIFRTSSGGYVAASSRHSSICLIDCGLSILAVAPSPWNEYSLILNRCLKLVSQPFDYLGSSLFRY
jgi:hypothetical protein